jgi:hypothetical protein
MEEVMAETYQMVRLRTATYERLWAAIHRRAATADLGRMDPWWSIEGLTADGMVNWLLAHVERDRRRAARSRAKRRLESNHVEYLGGDFDGGERGTR